MAKRDTVNVDCNKIDILRKANEWNQSAFSRKVGKYSSWYSEVLRGNNLPSPEEAACMCILLKTTPNDILLHEGSTPEETAKCLEDIQRVKELVAELTAESEEKRSAKGEALSPVEQEIFDFISAASVEEVAEMLRFIGYLKSKREQAHGPSETLQSS
jgi:transcriptional regulator with XRE-family HTH domain